MMKTVSTRARAQSFSDSLMIKYKKNKLFYSSVKHIDNTGTVFTLTSKVEDKEKEKEKNSPSFICEGNAFIKKIENEKRNIIIKNSASLAENYIDLSSCDMRVARSDGIAIDNSGHLILVKNSISASSRKKLFSKKKDEWELYRIFLSGSDYSKLLFSSIFVDCKGKLIGRNKKYGTYYEIKLSASKIICQYSVTLEEMNFSISDYDATDIEKQLKIFIFKGVSFYTDFTKDTLILSDSIEKNKFDEKNEDKIEIKVPLKRGLEIKHVKVMRESIQLVISGSGIDDTRICYIKPKNICLNKEQILKLSSSPPHGFLSSIAPNIFDTFSPGLPFRLGKKRFFSKFRTSLTSRYQSRVSERPKNKIWEGREKRVNNLLNYIKPLDPGIRAATSAISKFREKDNIEKDGFFNSLADLNTGHGKILNEIYDDVMKNKTYSEKIEFIMNSIEIDESITLTNEARLFFFFGFAITGSPLSPGFFTGLVAEMIKTYEIILTKLPDGETKFSFQRKLGTSLYAICGTGQGLERTAGEYNHISFLTVLPFEANIILNVFKKTSISFSFILKTEKIHTFISGKIDNQENKIESKLFNVELTKHSESGSAFFLEAKAEGRLQLGTSPIVHLFLVSPRTAIAPVCSLNLFTFMKEKEQATLFEIDNSKLEETSVNHQNSYTHSSLDALKMNLSVITEGKVMPIILTSTESEGGIAVPLPLPLRGTDKILKRATISPLKNSIPIDFTCPSVKILEKCINKLAGISGIILQKKLKSYTDLKLLLALNNRELTESLENNPTSLMLLSELKKIKEKYSNLQINQFNKRKKIYFELHYEPDGYMLKKAKDKIEYIQRLTKAYRNLSKKYKYKFAKTVYSDTEKLISETKLKLRTIIVKCSGKISKSKTSIPLILGFKSKRSIACTTVITKFDLFYRKEKIELTGYKQDKM